MLLFIIINFIIIGISNHFLFSVIISIYNSGRFLEDAIKSLLNQNIGLDKIQIILVNDGSTDDSEKICLKYKKLYDKNIVYSYISHSGVSKARNVGLNYANGLFINFLDSDDKWDIKAFKLVYLFYKLYHNVDIIAGRIKYFESKYNYHLLDYKFKMTRVVNLTDEYSFIQLSASSSFFRSSLIKGKTFKEGVLFGEDIRFIANNLLNKPLLGIIREAVYYYRKRSDSTSAIQNTEENNLYYFSTIQNVQQYLINESIRLYNKILPFIQYLIAYEVLFRIKSKAFRFLNPDNYRDYSKVIKNLLTKIEDKYILEQKIFTSNLQIYALSKKYNKDLRNDIILLNNSFVYSNYIIINLNTYKNIIIWRTMKVIGNKLFLKGEDRFWLPREKFFYYCQIANQTFFPIYYLYSGYDFITMDGTITKGRIIYFEISIDIKERQIISFYISYLGINIEIFTAFDFFTHIPPIKNSYYTTQNFIFINSDKNLIIYPYNQNLEISFELNYLNELKKLHQNNIIKLRKNFIENKKKIKNKENTQIWIINDRKDRGGDNGEYFFRYLNRIKPKGIKYFFAINKNSSDFYRLKLYSNIIDFDSKEYLNLFLNSRKIISSVSDSWVYNPFGANGKYLCDLYKFDFIYLNNGIIKDDLSFFLNKIKKNFDLLITSSYQEYKSLIKLNYGYNSMNDIVLTGLPRFDNLKKLQEYVINEKLILIFPTWRMYIKGTQNLLTHENIPSEYFKNSKFFNFYNNLINNDTLLKFMDKNNYYGIFCLHPNFEAQYKYFNQNKIFYVMQKCNNQELLAKSSLLITDYSSIFFDFGYIFKPVIYAQFDYEEYRNNHFPQGYFDYQKDGFGPICYDLGCTIKAIISEIENNCKLGQIYLKRIYKFFKFFDENNSYRTYLAIINNKNINNRIFKEYVFSFFIFFFLFKILRKEIHFSRFKNSPLYIN